MKSLSIEQMEQVEGGLSRTERNAGCATMGLAAGIASGFNPFVGGLTTLGCMMLNSYSS